MIDREEKLTNKAFNHIVKDFSQICLNKQFQADPNSTPIAFYKKQASKQELKMVLCGVQWFTIMLIDMLSKYQLFNIKQLDPCTVMIQFSFSKANIDRIRYKKYKDKRLYQMKRILLKYYKDVN